MKTRDIATNYNLEFAPFESWLRSSSGIPFKTGMMGGLSIDDDTHIDEAVSRFRQYQEESYANSTREKEEAEAAARLKQQTLARMLITSGFSFDGYKIAKYSGYISGDDVVQVDRGTAGIFSRATNVGESLMASLSNIRRKALTELKEAAYDLGCNAVIGVDFDYLTLDPQTASSSGGTMYLPYVFGVTANGNAVVIEKLEGRGHVEETVSNAGLV